MPLTARGSSLLRTIEKTYGHDTGYDAWATRADFDESKVKRARNGQFAKSAGGGEGAKKETGAKAAVEKPTAAPSEPKKPGTILGQETKGFGLAPEAILKPYKPKGDLNVDVFNGKTKKVRGYIKKGLMDIADVFIKETGVSPDDILDIQLVGSIATFAYREGSDLDLHIIVKPSAAEDKQKLLQAKSAAFKTKFKDKLSIGGMPVECSIEEKGGPTKADGRFSLRAEKWVAQADQPKNVPSRWEVALAAGKMIHKVQTLLKSNDPDEISKFLGQTYSNRRRAFTEEGEWGMDNIVFKILRTRGLLQKLHDRVLNLTAKRLSVKKPANGDPALDAAPTDRARHIPSATDQRAA